MDQDAHGLLQAISEDPFLSPFASSEFDCSEFVGAVIAGPQQQYSGGGGQQINAVLWEHQSLEAACEVINNSMHRVDAVIRKHILVNEEALLGSVGSVSDLSARCDGLRSGLRELKRGLAKVKRGVGEPYNATQATVTELQNIQRASRTVKQLQRMLTALARLKQQEDSAGLGATDRSPLTKQHQQRPSNLRDLASAATSLRDLESILADDSMAGITAVEEQRQYVHTSSTSCRRMAAEALAKGLAAPNLAQVSSALQVFYNLGCLPERVKQCVSRIVDHSETAIGKAFVSKKLATVAGDARGPGNVAPAGARRNSSRSTAAQEDAHLRHVSEEIAVALQECCKQADRLHKVLVSTIDPVTHEVFLSSVNRDPLFVEDCLAHQFWVSISAVLRRSLEKAVEQQTLAAVDGKEAAALIRLENMYPHLSRAVIHSLHRLVDASTATAVKGSAASDGKKVREEAASRLARPDAKGILGGTQVRLSRTFSSLSLPAGIHPPSESSVIESVKPLGEDLLLDALSPLQDQYLGASLARLTTPIQQMFAHAAGYSASVPSKHDLSSFLRAIVAELRAVAGNLSLTRAVLRGITKAVKVFAAKAEDILNASPEAFAVVKQVGQPRPWARTRAQQHNHDVLILLARLREGLAEVPAQLVMSKGSAATAQAMEEALQEYHLHITEAISCLDVLALEQILTPLFLGTATVLEAGIARMHRENYGKGASSAASGGTAGFVAEFDISLSGLWQEHLEPVSQLGVPFAADALRALVMRLLRTFVSHAALVRPLEEAGLLKLAHDLAQFEASLSLLAHVNTMEEAYQELRAFRQLIFIEDPEQSPRSFLSEDCLRELRPSTVLHFLCSRCPGELSSPHVARSQTQTAFVHWLIGGDAAHEWQSRQSVAASSGSAPELDQRKLEPDVSYEAEAQAWANMQLIIDSFVQRKSASSGSGGDPPPPSVDILTKAGPALLALYANSSAYVKRNR